MRTLITLLLSLVLSTLCLAAQDAGQQTRLPVFEVSSLRHNTSGDTISSARWFPGGRFTAVNARLDHLVLQAFGIPIGLAHIYVDGGLRLEMKCLRNCSSRDETLSARFDVQAITAEDVPPDQQPLVLRALLVERFKLKAHLVTRDAPLYALTVARQGRLGPRLHPSSHNCEALARARNEALAQGLPGPTPPSGADGKPLCVGGVDMSRSQDFVYIRKSAGPIANLVSSIRGELPFAIVDRTGLTGNFEWELTSAIPGIPESLVKSNAPPMEVALQEQLGLRLVRSTEPLQVLVIESVAMPTPN